MPRFQQHLSRLGWLWIISALPLPAQIDSAATSQNIPPLERFAKFANGAGGREPSENFAQAALSADNAVAAVFSGGDSARSSAIKPASAAASAPLQNAAALATPKAPDNSALAYLGGTGVILFGVFIFTQRRRLGRVWLQFKPALASGAGAIREERLIPIVAARQALNKSNGASENDGQKPPNAETHAVAAARNSATTNDRAEAQDPFLQTQAFFAEMIAAEPELSALVDNWQETPEAFEAVTKPSNGQADLPVAEALLLS
jgi:hypothetical protein